MQYLILSSGGGQLLFLASLLSQKGPAKCFYLGCINNPSLERVHSEICGVLDISYEGFLDDRLFIHPVTHLNRSFSYLRRGRPKKALHSLRYAFQPLIHSPLKAHKGCCLLVPDRVYSYQDQHIHRSLKPRAITRVTDGIIVGEGSNLLSTQPIFYGPGLRPTAELLSTQYKPINLVLYQRLLHRAIKIPLIEEFSKVYTLEDFGTLLIGQQLQALYGLELKEELELYISITRIARPPVLYKPHPRDSTPKLKTLQSYGISVIDSSFQAIPVELLLHLLNPRSCVLGIHSSALVIAKEMGCSVSSILPTQFRRIQLDVERFSLRYSIPKIDV